MRRNVCFLMLFAIALWGCSASRYKQLADEETYRIINAKHQQVFGEPATGFTIEKQPLPEFIRSVGSGQETQPPSEEKPVPSGLSDREIEELTDEQLEALLNLSYEKTAELIIPPPPDAVKLTLAQTIELAVANSRRFQSEKESLFMRALSLTYQRHLWRPQLGLTGSTTYEKDDQDESIGGGGKFSVGQMLASGARLALNLSTSFAEFFTGDRRRAVGSLISLGITQPLLRGGGRLVAREGLTQAERSMVYDVRAFARFRKDFSVDVADRFYTVLQQRDSLINTFRSYIRLRRGTKRETELQKAGQSTKLNVYEAEQDELQAKNNWIIARQEYLDQLDRFKIDPLGLATEAAVVVDEKELEVLKNTAASGLALPEATQDEAVRRAIANRLDLMNAEDALEDSLRAVAIAEDALRAGLDISLSSSANTEPSTKALKFEFNKASYSAGLSLDLPIDRKQERNAYRQALIALESQKRSLSLLRDNIKLEVRRAYRDLLRAKQTFEIQKISVELAETRVDNARMERDLGRATTRDVLFAEDALLSAQNGLTTALVRYEIARLQLLLSTEEFHVNERGLWLREETSVRGDDNVNTTDEPDSEKKELSES